MTFMFFTSLNVDTFKNLNSRTVLISAVKLDLELIKLYFQEALISYFCLLEEHCFLI